MCAHMHILTHMSLDIVSLRTTDVNQVKQREEHMGETSFPQIQNQALHRVPTAHKCILSRSTGEKRAIFSMIFREAGLH